jgi:hypothetical protein
MGLEFLIKKWEWWGIFVLWGSSLLVLIWTLHIEWEVDKVESTKLREVYSLIEKNHALITQLSTNSKARPLAFDACDGVLIISQLRAQGVSIPKYEFETRCEAKKE